VGCKRSKSWLMGKLADQKNIPGLRIHDREKQTPDYANEVGISREAEQIGKEKRSRWTWGGWGGRYIQIMPKQFLGGGSGKHARLFCHMLGGRT